MDNQKPHMVVGVDLGMTCECREMGMLDVELKESKLHSGYSKPG